jgi:hypothetical protein
MSSSEQSVTVQETIGPAARSRLRVAVLMDGPDTPLWVHEAIGEIHRADHLDLAQLIVRLRIANPQASMPALLRVWIWADRHLFKPKVDLLRYERREYSVDTIRTHSRADGDEHGSERLTSTLFSTLPLRQCRPKSGRAPNTEYGHSVRPTAGHGRASTLPFGSFANPGTSIF